MQFLIRCIVFSLSLCFLGSAFGTEGDWKERLTIDGKGFLRYSYDWAGSNGKNYNEFDIDRLYLGFTWKLADHVKVRHLLEAGDLRESGTEQFETTTKQFYLEIADSFYEGSFLRFGQNDLPWVGYVDGIWGYRLQGSNFSDRSKFLTSTDLGIGIGGKIPENYGSWQMNLVNGEGWKKNESGKLKDFHARLTLNPFAGNLFVSGALTQGEYEGISPGKSTDKRRTNFLVGYKEKGSFTLMGEYLMAKDPVSKMSGNYSALSQRASHELTDAKGFALYGVLNMGLLGGEDFKKWELISRYDSLDPDHSIADLSVTRWIMGLSCECYKNVVTLLNYEAVSNKAGGKDERRIQFQTEVKF